MAIFKSIVAGLLALLLALPSPSLCYADIVADEGANHVSEAQNSQEDGESFEDQSGADHPTEQESSNGQRSNSNESSRSSSGDGAAFSVSSDSSQEGLENGDFVDNAAVRSNGFDSSDYPAEYSDPSFNSYLGYARDDLQEAIKQFYDLSESRELTDDENYQATLALFAWFYLDYGSTDDLVQAAVSSDWILSQILGSFAFSTKDLFYGIWYMFYGTPSSWGATPPFDTYSRHGLVWYVVNIDSKLTSVYNQVTNTYNRLGGVYDRMATIINNLGNLYDRLGGIYDRIGSLIESNGTNLTLIYNRLAGIYDRQGTAINGISDIYERVDNLDKNLVYLYERLGGVYNREGTIISFLTSLNSLVDNINVNLVYVYERLLGLYDREGVIIERFDDLLNAGISLDMLGVESRLDTIITMLGIAGAKDLLETFLGDFNLDASSALAAAISSAMQNVFPFCIPAILKQCLGLMQAEAHAPVFEFDIFGAPLVLDFTAQGLCDISQVTSWFCRISFLILLLVNTKKFIFTINNRGAQDG